MSTTFEQRISRLVNAGAGASLRGGFKGIEKESLRVTADGYLSDKPHPAGLGSALTNRYITTDFSESLLEFVTPAVPRTWEALGYLCDIHKFTYEHLDDELLWVTSMPCRIPEEPEIPLARYGTSNVGRMKTIYRNGLGYRYGRAMQTIAGLHFNYSLPEAFWPVWQSLERSSTDATAFRSDAYLGLVRNFRRFGWLVLYLFGASPALCKSFPGGGAAAQMPSLDQDTLYEPYATSLRMSDLGYSNKAQAKLNISLNRLDEYVSDLTRAIMTPEPSFQKIGIRENGEYRQLNGNLLQIENEYYSPIRPKRVARSGERPTAALQRGGVEYVEVRSLDLNASDPTGINQHVMRFMEAFLVYCLLEDSPLLDDPAWDEFTANHGLVAKRGREPGLQLARNNESIALNVWADEIMQGVATVAALIDPPDRADFSQSVRELRKFIADPDATPSARLLRELSDSGASFFEFALDAARGHRDYFNELAALPVARYQAFEAEAASSVERQRAIEAADNISFDEYLQAYYSAD